MSFYSKIFLAVLLISLPGSHALARTKSALKNPARQSKKPSAQYSACQNADLSQLESLSASKQSALPKITGETEADFCFSCEWEKAKNQARDFFGLKTVKKADDLPHAKEFKEKLRKRAIGQAMANLYQSEYTWACLRSDEDWFSQEERKSIQSSLRAMCGKRSKELRRAVKKSWPKMRANMALMSANLLGSPAYGFQRLRMMDGSPSHTALPGASDMPPLNEEERRLAAERHIEALSALRLDKLSAEDLARQLRDKKKMPGGEFWAINQKDLTNKDIKKIKEAQKKLRAESEKNYVEMLSEMPFLAYLKNGEAKKEDLDSAFLGLSKHLKNFLNKLKDPEVDMAVLLSFNSLAESVLKEDNKYCLAAEGARIDAEEEKSFDRGALIGLGLAAIAPCLISGPFGAGACAAGGAVAGLANYARAKTAQKESLRAALSGANLEKLAEWREKGDKANMEAMLLPLAFIGSPVSAVTRSTVQGAKSARAYTRLARSVKKEAPQQAATYITQQIAAYLSGKGGANDLPQNTVIKPENPLPKSEDKALNKFREIYNVGAYSNMPASDGLFYDSDLMGQAHRYISVKYDGEKRPAIIGGTGAYGSLRARINIEDKWKTVNLKPEQLKTARLNEGADKLFSQPSKLPLTGDLARDEFRKAVNENKLPENKYIELDFFGSAYYGEIRGVRRNPETGQPEVTIDFIDNSGRLYSDDKSKDRMIGPRIIHWQNMPFIKISHKAESEVNKIKKYQQNWELTDFY